MQKQYSNLDDNENIEDCLFHDTFVLVCSNVLIQTRNYRLMSVTWSLHGACNITEQHSGVLKYKNNNITVVIWKYKDESICMNTRRITRRLFLLRYNVTQADRDRTRNASFLGNRDPDIWIIQRKDSLRSQLLDEAVLTFTSFVGRDVLASL